MKQNPTEASMTKMPPVPKLFKCGEDGKALAELAEGNEWVLEGKGLLTIKIDGQECKVQEGKLFLRLNTFKDSTYVLCDRDAPEDKALWTAFDTARGANVTIPDGIYIAYGPGIRGNAQNADRPFMFRIAPIDAHLLISNDQQQTKIRRGHGVSVITFFDSIKEEFLGGDIEGLVYHYEDPCFHPKAFAQVTRRDMGLPWPLPTTTHPKLIEPANYSPSTVVMD